MMSFFDLPSDLSVSILREWLADLKSIVALDSAAAKSVRSEFLSLLAHPTFLLPSALELGDSINCGDLISWVNTRLIKFSSLLTTVQNMQFCLQISNPRLATVRGLTVRSGPDDGGAFDNEMLRRLLALLPSLSAVDMSACIPLDTNYLMVLASSGLQLKVVKLDDTIVSCDLVDVLITAISSTVEVLVSGASRKLDDHTLTLIATRCAKVRSLHFACKEDVSSQVFMNVLGSDALPLLKSVEVCNRGPDLAAFNDEVAAAIFNHHPLLAYFSAMRMPSIAFSTCADAVGLCPNLVHFATASFQLSHTLKGKMCTLTLFARAVLHDSLSDSLVKLSFNRKINNLLFYRTLADPLLLEVLSMLGKNLGFLHCCLNQTPNDDKIVQQITLKCSSLVALCLFYSNSITDHSIRAIADNCHLLKQLSLCGAAIITDFGMCYLLGKFGERLVGLHLVHCDNLTDAIFVPLLTFCTQLEHLKIQNAGHTSVTLRDQLIIPNRLLCLKRLWLGAVDYEFLHSFALNNNALDARWIKLLSSMD